MENKKEEKNMELAKEMMKSKDKEEIKEKNITDNDKEKINKIIKEVKENGKITYGDLGKSRTNRFCI